MNLSHILRSFSIRTRMYGAMAMVLCLLGLVAAGGIYGLTSLLENPVQASTLIRSMPIDFCDLVELGKLG
jgi:hypothetical protein